MDGSKTPSEIAKPLFAPWGKEIHAPDVRPGLARELRKHVAILEPEIAGAGGKGQLWVWVDFLPVCLDAKVLGEHVHELLVFAEDMYERAQFRG